MCHFQPKNLPFCFTCIVITLLWIVYFHQEHFLGTLWAPLTLSQLHFEHCYYHEQSCLSKYLSENCYCVYQNVMNVVCGGLSCRHMFLLWFFFVDDFTFWMLFINELLKILKNFWAFQETFSPHLYWSRICCDSTYSTRSFAILRYFLFKFFLSLCYPYTIP